MGIILATCLNEHLAIPLKEVTLAFYAFFSLRSHLNDSNFRRAEGKSEG